MAASAARELEPGTPLGNYIVERKLGEGGIGTVYLGRHAVVHQDVALKVQDRVPDDDEIRAAFCEAANYLSQLNHRNIVRLHDYGLRENLAYQALEYVDGPTLAQLIPEQQSAAWVARALDVIGQLLPAVRYAHGCRYRDLDGSDRIGIFHGDIKPQNVLMTSSGDPKLTDFMVPDVQRYLMADRRFNRETTEAFGTPGYMAPEQYEGRVDARCDIYSLGQTMFELLTGYVAIVEGGRVLAFASSGAAMGVISGTPASLNPHVPPWLDELVVRAIQFDPEDRFASVAEMERVVLERTSSNPSSTLNVQELHMGDRIHVDTGDVGPGQVFIGKFHDVVNTVEQKGEGELAEALKLLKEAIMASNGLSDGEKSEQVGVVTHLAEESAKEQPNRTVMKMLTDGLMTALRAVPDVAQAVAAAATVIARFT